VHHGLRPRPIDPLLAPRLSAHLRPVLDEGRVLHVGQARRYQLHGALKDARVARPALEQAADGALLGAAVLGVAQRPVREAALQHAQDQARVQQHVAAEGQDGDAPVGDIERGEVVARHDGWLHL
jgi:hypothetical protein